jgi:hypothetical protein
MINRIFGLADGSGTEAVLPSPRAEKVIAPKKREHDIKRAVVIKFLVGKFNGMLEYWNDV